MRKIPIWARARRLSQKQAVMGAVAILAVILLVAAACGDDDTPTPVQSTPTPVPGTSTLVPPTPTPVNPIRWYTPSTHCPVCSSPVDTYTYNYWAERAGRVDLG